MERSVDSGGRQSGALYTDRMRGGDFIAVDIDDGYRACKGQSIFAEGKESEFSVDGVKL